MPAANTLTAQNALAIDTQGLESLRIKAKTNPGESVAAVSKQFEALFLGMVMKSMRSASPQDGPFDNEQTKLYTSLLDQQLAQHMAKRGTGLAEVMTRQLSANFSDSMKAGPLFTDAAAAAPAAAPVTVPSASRSSPSNQPAGDFVHRVWPHAVQAAQTLGVQPQFIVGQAALESGWGKHEIRAADGQPSHNLFGIKAGGNWKGSSVNVPTLEYVNGVPVKTVDKFRVYDSYAESFRDYANLLRDNARYSGVIGQDDAKGFAQALQRGGYATDPAYADKLVSVINNARDMAAPKAQPDAPADTTLAQRSAPGVGLHIVAAGFAPSAPNTINTAYAGGLVRAAYSAGGAAATRSEAVPMTLERAAAATAAAPPLRQPDAFVNSVWAGAVDAAQTLGVQPEFIVGQAALETGWGKHEIRTADGQPSHNLFGIKAGKDWSGPTVNKTVTTYVNGTATKVVEKFRVYASYADGLRDYAIRLRDNTRYASVAGQADARGFARELQRSGYATDPVYADKLVSVINSPPIRQVVIAERRPQVLAQR